MPDAGMCGHVDTRTSPVDPRLPRALGARDSAVLVEFGRVLTEVPNVAVRVLAVPVGRPLSKTTADEEAVADDDTRHPGDRLRGSPDGDDVARGLTVCLTPAYT